MIRLRSSESEGLQHAAKERKRGKVGAIVGVAKGAETSANDVTGRLVVVWVGKNAALEGGEKNIDGDRPLVQRVCWWFFTVSEKPIEEIDFVLAVLTKA